MNSGFFANEVVSKVNFHCPSSSWKSDLLQDLTGLNSVNLKNYPLILKQINIIFYNIYNVSKLSNNLYINGSI